MAAAIPVSNAIRNNWLGGITDIKVGPDDGYLYVLTFDSSQGTIFRIVPKALCRQLDLQKKYSLSVDDQKIKICT